MNETPVRTRAYLSETGVVFNNVTTFRVVEPWQWETTDATFKLINPEHTVVSADSAKVKDYSFTVEPGKTKVVDITAQSLEVDRASVPAALSGTVTTQFVHLQGRYSVDYTLKLELSLPTFPFDARHDVGELHVDIVIATVQGCGWSVNSGDNSFVITVDVSSMLQNAVGVLSSIVVSRPLSTAIYKVAGLVTQDAGSIRFGCKWSWEWSDSWGKNIEYVVNVFTNFRTYARSVYYLPIRSDRSSSEASDLDGDCDVWTLVPMND